MFANRLYRNKSIVNKIPKSMYSESPKIPEDNIYKKIVSEETSSFGNYGTTTTEHIRNTKAGGWTIIEKVNIVKKKLEHTIS